MTKDISYDSILKALDEIKSNLESGDSIQLARTKACGQPQNALCKKVMRTDEYRVLLNKYLSTSRSHFRYESKEGSLVFKKKEKAKSNSRYEFRRGF